MKPKLVKKKSTWWSKFILLAQTQQQIQSKLNQLQQNLQSITLGNFRKRFPLLSRY